MKTTRLLILFTMIAAGTVFAWGQDDPSYEMGTKAFGAYDASSIDTTSLSNGSTNLFVPLVAYKQRGAHPPLVLGLEYYNNGWFADWSCQPVGGRAFSGILSPPRGSLCTGTINNPFPSSYNHGFQFVEKGGLAGLGGSGGYAGFGVTCVGSVPDTHGVYQRYNCTGAVTEWDGAVHQFAPISNTTWLAVDGSGYRMDFPGGFNNAFLVNATGITPTNAVLTDPNGIRRWVDPTITDVNHMRIFREDTNGNRITWQQSGYMDTTTGYTDTMGRNIPNFLGAWLAADDTYIQSGTPGDTSGCTGPLPIAYAFTWNPPGPNGGTYPIKFCYVIFTETLPTVPVPGQPIPPVTIDLKLYGGALQSIVLPDQSTWTFQYSTDGHGDLAQVTFPTGGTLSYTWTSPQTWTSPSSPQFNFTRGIATRILDPHDGSVPAKTSYNYYNGTTTVTDPAGNDTVHTFTAFAFNPYETQVQFYQGPSSGGSLLRTVKKEYSFVNPPSSWTDSMNTVLSAETTIFPSGKQGRAEYDYDSTPITFHGYAVNFTWVGLYDVSGNFVTPVSNVPGRYKKRVATREYDFGNSAPGPLLKQTVTSYVWEAASSQNSPCPYTLAANANAGAYFANNLLNLVASTQVQDGSCNLAAQSNFGYDESSLQGSGITTQLTSNPPTGLTRGNMTSVGKRLNTTNSYVTSSIKWFDTGEVYQSIDALGHTTTHTYDPLYAGAYSTQTCNALSQCVNGTYDFNTGFITSFTDANGNAGDPAHTSLFEYNDPLVRVTKVTRPADSSGNHPVTTFKYPDENTVEALKSVTTALTDDAFSYFDGLGRTTKSVHVTAGNATVQTAFDVNGRVASVTNPFFTTGDPTYGVTASQYDALGRVTTVIPPDGSAGSNNVATDYSNFPAVTVTDQAGNQRRTTTDGLGRLIEVDEPGGGSSGSPASGSLTISGTLQSKAIPAQGATNASGVFLIHAPCNGCDGNSGTVTVGTFSASGSGSTANAIASSLISNLTQSGSPVTASLGSQFTPPLNTVYVTISNKIAGTAGNNLGVSCGSSPICSGTIFLSGGTDATPASTIYDSGNISMTGPNFNVSVPYGQSTNSTSTQIAQALTQALPGATNFLASAGFTGTAISIVDNAGTGANGAVALTESSNSPGTFSLSFSSTGTTLSGGANGAPYSLSTPYVTLYSYDGLGDLLTVTQKGDPTVTTSGQWRVRNFTYDSLGRLLTAQNPESGIISYSYDANSNLLQKTLPAPNQTGAATQTISYCYDALNRVTGKAYSAQTCQNGQLPTGTAVVSYTYDLGTNAKGKLTSFTDQAGSGSYTYDALGRTAGETRVIAGMSKSVNYAYNLDGSPKTLSYPSGASVTYTPDSAGRMLSAVDTGNGINYVTGATYGPSSGLTGFVSGNTGSFAGITNAFSYNKRLQPINMSATSPSATVFSIGYDFHLGASDNGNVWGITNYKDANRNQSFTYDTLNRLTSAQNAGTDCGATTVNGKTEYWGNSYGYDAWGNQQQKTVTKCKAENLSVMALTNNQLSGYGYDAAGNMTNDPTDSVTSTYDPENRIATATRNGVTTTYTYDDDGNRVKKTSGSTGTLYWYMSPGIVAESDLAGNLQSEYVFFDGERVARKDFPGLAVSYYFSDHLKTASVITDSSGNIKSESDYYPWGGELQFSNSDSNHYKFTGKERDSETGLDYFGARYFSNGLGRFITSDPYNVIVQSDGKKDFLAYLGQPQNWNRYAYVWNNPLRYTDPYGERVFVVTYTQGNESGDEEFKKAAETHAREIQSRKDFDPKKDTVLLAGVNSIASFENVINQANGLDKQFGKVQEISLYSHAGDRDGPNFNEGHNHKGGKVYTNEQYIDRSPSFHVNWSSSAEARFYGCYTASNFAGQFANAQRVPTWGLDFFSSFSSKPDSRSYWYIFGGKDLYMTTRDGRPPVRKDPETPKPK